MCATVCSLSRLGPEYHARTPTERRRRRRRRRRRIAGGVNRDEEDPERDRATRRRK